MLQGSITGVLKFLSHPLVRRLVKVLPEDKLIVALGELALKFWPEHQASIVAGLNWIKELQPEGGYRQLLADEAFHEELRQFLVELEEYRNPTKGGMDEKVNVI